MNNLLLSKFETYLLDEKLEIECEEMEEYINEESNNYEEYPPGFFSDL
ncbi:hypothetical protein H9636_09965 [Ureibacillus sp. Re31]|uniref:Uncharacterized protein n=1 Tax=Ureibacillus galli TaxID=2762222 RepID=A0ABR8XCL2_9BACL|nr:hypothetical protein [Ureibacillus galli]MBD8026979.1 hypothetical protein [Ureibacillus galli]